MTATELRPRMVTIAFWTLLVGAVLLMTGGLLAATLSFGAIRAAAAPSVADETIHNYLRFSRGAGIGCALAGIALAVLAGRTRAGDERFRRATMALGLATVVLVGLLEVFSPIGLLPLLSLLPIIAGTLLLSRPASASWFKPDGNKLEPDV